MITTEDNTHNYNNNDIAIDIPLDTSSVNNETIYNYNYNVYDLHIHRVYTFSLVCILIMSTLMIVDIITSNI